MSLTFAKGKVVKAKASHGEKELRTMIKEKNADKLGEFSLTDRRLSRITKFMAHTLYDENVGGKYGNTHVAVGRSYQVAYDGDPEKLSPREWEKLGFNNSGVHTDVVSTTDRTVTAHLKNKTTKIIYKKGEFQL